MSSALDPPLPHFDAIRERSAHARSTVLSLTAAAIMLSFMFDAIIATFLHSRGIDDTVKHAGAIVHLIKLAGLFWYTLAVASVLTFVHPLRWRAGLFEIFCGSAAGLNYAIKWIAGRVRPFKLAPFDTARPFHFSICNGGWFGFMHQWDLSFVSGHAAVAFATAAGLDQLLPAHRSIVRASYMIALLLLAERVLENAHWLSDTTCAAALGMGSAWLLARWTHLPQKMAAS